MRSGYQPAGSGRTRIVAESSRTAPGRIFISYRREETAYAAGWLFNRLADEFGRGQVFKDVDSIELGDDFVEVITNAVGSTDVLLALIGDEWLTMTDEHGKRRLDDPDDFVRLEIEAALARKVRLIPILVDGARMPGGDELPPSLAPLARRQALELSPSRFDFDTSRLLEVLDKTLTEDRTGRDDTASLSALPAKAHEPDKKQVEAPDHRGDTPTVTPGAARPAGPAWWQGLFSRSRILIGAGISIAAVLLVIVIVAMISTESTSQDREDGNPTPEDQTGDNPPTEAIAFVDDFSSQDRGWDDAEDTQTGGHYRDGAYYISAERIEDKYHSVLATPRDAASPASLRIKVNAHRVGGTARLGYGYGIFCKASGPDDLYVFTIWGRLAEIGKYSRGVYIPLGKETSVHSSVQGDTEKELRAICRNEPEQLAVNLQFWVNGDRILRLRDTNRPLQRGSFGLQVTLGPSGDPGDTLEAKFDNFEVSED
jgi:hypothetical protein